MMRSSRKPRTRQDPLPSSKSIRVERIIETALRERKADTLIDEAALIAEHPELMPELGKEIATLRQLDEAASYAKQHPVSSRSQDTDDAEIDDAVNCLTETLTGYEILDRIHYGGQGVVYRAVQRHTGRLVAIKVLLHGPFASKRERLRFEREVALASRLRHPNIVTIYESGSVRGIPYFAMEHVEGLPIDDYFLLQSTPARDRIRVFIAVCRAVGHAHRRGIIHRDLKPDNILVEPDSGPKILDFGLAKDFLTPDGRTVSVDGRVVGTLPYLSPEQARGRIDDVDTRSDIYALGVVLFEVLTGGFPYPVTGAPETVRSDIVSREPARLRRVLQDADPGESMKPGDISIDLEAVVHKALQKEPKLRYQSAEAFAEDLERYLAGEAVVAKGTTGFYVLRKTISRHRVPVAIAAAFLLLMGVAAGAIFRVALQRDTAQATGVLRVNLARKWDTGLIRELHANMANSSRLAEITVMPADVVNDYLTRYHDTPRAPFDEFTDLTSGMPQNFVEAIRDPEHRGFCDACTWLRQAEPRLMSIARALETSSVQFTLDDYAGFTMNSAAAYQLDAVGVVDAFVGQAYRSYASGNLLQAVASLTAARRLAQDLGDGMTLVHRAGSINCCARIYACIQHILTWALRNGEPTGGLTGLLRNDPPLVALSPALRIEIVLKYQLITAAFDARLAGESNYFNFATFNDDVAPGILGDVNAVQRERASRVTLDDVEHMFETFSGSAKHWEQSTLVGLESAMIQWHDWYAATSAQNPLVLILPQVHNCFRVRLMTVALRRALRLAAFAVRECKLRGRWPDRLIGTLPSEWRLDLADPITGQTFVYDIVGATPRVRSRTTSGLSERSIKLICQYSERVSVEEGRITYFPAYAHGKERANTP